MQPHQRTETSDLSLAMVLVFPASDDTQEVKVCFCFPHSSSQPAHFAVKLPANPLEC